MTVTVFEKRTCSKCRAVVELLEARGVAFERIDLHEHGLDEATLRDLVAKTGGRALDLLRADEPEAAELGLADPALDDDERVRRMASRPRVVQRPIVVVGDRAVVARPADRVLDLLA